MFSIATHAVLAKTSRWRTSPGATARPATSIRAAQSWTAFEAYDQAFGAVPHQICYAVKANANLAILKLLAEAGAGFDIVSGGELFRVLKAGGDPARVIVFRRRKNRARRSTTRSSSSIRSFNCESEPELALDRLAGRTPRGVKARVAMRVNPDVDAATHPYISTGLRKHKFGIDIARSGGRLRARQILRQSGARRRELPHRLADCSISSPMLEVFDKMVALVERLRAAGLPIRTLDLGGGLGVPYKPDDNAPRIAEFIHGHVRESGRSRSGNPDRARPLHRGGGRRAADARALPQDQRRTRIRHRGCRP